GSLVEWLAAAPGAAPLCGRLGAMLSVEDAAGRAPRVLADGETMALGTKRVRCFDTPHVPHGWDAGYLSETSTRTLLCGDLLPRRAPPRRPCPRATSSVRARRCAGPWTTTRTPGPPPCRSSASPQASRRCSPACTGRRTGAMARPPFARSRRSCRLRKGSDDEPRRDASLHLRSGMGTPHRGPLRSPG